MSKFRVSLPELDSPIVQAALALSPDVTPVGAKDLTEACKLVKDGQADALVAGIDCPSRDVILACRDELGMTGVTFSACAVLTRGSERIYIADPVTCKDPTAAQLCDITLQSTVTAERLGDTPVVALLSYSTLGSGFNPEKPDPDIVKIRDALALIKQARPELLVDGEIQLDAAYVPAAGGTKTKNCPVAGHANILICPDLNSANILYKSLEHFAGFTTAGLIMQGFKAPVSDLSRGSTAEDIAATFRTMEELVHG